MKIKFGDNVKDTVTGFTGVVVAKTECMYATYPKFGVQPKDFSKSGPIFTEWFDEPRLEKLPKTKKVLDSSEGLEPAIKRGRKSKKMVLDSSLQLDEEKPKRRRRKVNREKMEKELANG